MTDYVSYEIKNCDPDILEDNEYVRFFDAIVLKTGEYGSYKRGYYKGLKFTIYYITEKTNYRRVTIAGSLHKYWNNGIHNYNDFGMKELVLVLKDIYQKFNIHPRNCILRSIEIGVNLIVPTLTKTVLENCILHKTKPFEPNTYRGKGYLIQNSKSHYLIKIYDKKLDSKEKGYSSNKELMRFEIRYLKMQFLNNLGIFTMQDLLNFGLEKFKPILLNHWKSILFFDSEALNKCKRKYQYNNGKFWTKLKKENFKYHRKKLNELTIKNNGNLKNDIYNIMNEKIDKLTKNTL